MKDVMRSIQKKDKNVYRFIEAEVRELMRHKDALEYQTPKGKPRLEWILVEDVFELHSASARS